MAPGRTLFTVGMRGREPYQAGSEIMGNRSHRSRDTQEGAQRERFVGVSGNA
jgi:hypothetical protein